MNKKIILWLLLIFWCGLIFFFSSQPAGNSSKLSSRITNIVVEIINELKEFNIPVFKDIEASGILILTENLEKIVRKCAHFGIFFILGTISVSLSDCYVKKWIVKIFSAFTFCVLYAASDEWHQLFVQGRSGSPIDVSIDSLGAFLGILITVFLIYSLRKHKAIQTE